MIPYAKVRICAYTKTRIPDMQKYAYRSGVFDILAYIISSALKSKRRLMLSAITMRERHLDSAF